MDAGSASVDSSRSTACQAVFSPVREKFIACRAAALGAASRDPGFLKAQLARIVERPSTGAGRSHPALSVMTVLVCGADALA